MKHYVLINVAMSVAMLMGDAMLQRCVFNGKYYSQIM